MKAKTIGEPWEPWDVSCIWNNRRTKILHRVEHRKRLGRKTEIRLKGGTISGTIPGPYFGRNGNPRPIAASVAMALIEKKVHCPQCCAEKHGKKGRSR